MTPPHGCISSGHDVLRCQPPAKLLELADRIGTRIPVGRVGAPKRAVREVCHARQPLPRDTAGQNPLTQAGDGFGGCLHDATLGHFNDLLQEGHCEGATDTGDGQQNDRMPRKTAEPPVPTASAEARQVYAFMTARGLTIYGWTKDAGISKNVLRNLFKGDSRQLDRDSLEALAKAIGVQPDDIAGKKTGELSGRRLDVATVEEIKRLLASLDEGARKQQRQLDSAQVQIDRIEDALKAVMDALNIPRPAPPPADVPERRIRRQ